MKSLLIILGIIAFYAILHILIPGLTQFNFIRTGLMVVIGLILLGVGAVLLLFKK